jgi:phosphinothricin acetyltransferase
VRPARIEDLAELTEIYNHYVLSSHVTFDVEPFTVEGRREWLAHYADDGPFRLLVAEAAGAVQDYASSSPFRGRAAYRTSVETSVYCRPDSTGRGVGTLLYGHLFDRLAGQGLHRAYAGITLPNDASLALHRRFGFREIGTFGEVGHKLGRYWDVLWLEKPL